MHVRTVAERGWGGITNGKLLALAAAEFDVFITVDRNLSFQQHLPKFDETIDLSVFEARYKNDDGGAPAYARVATRREKRLYEEG